MKNLKAREKAPWLKALDVLAENQGSTSSVHGISQPSETPIPGDLRLSSGLYKYHVCMWDTEIHAGKVLIHINKITDFC